jgi:pimeloyl-ACP methyl ester carboxylesterase
VKRIKVNGVELCAETFGDPADPPVLLVGVTMLSWPDELCAALAGRYAVRYDLRDAGRSTFVDPDAPAYDLRDLVTDASELLMALDLGRTHVVGLGVGGFIAQLLALDAGRPNSCPIFSAAWSGKSGSTGPGATGRVETSVPTLVVHGDEDPFFPHGNGVALAAEIPGATLLTLPGIGQGLPRVTWPDVVEALLRHTF